MINCTAKLINLNFHLHLKLCLSTATHNFKGVKLLIFV